MHFHSPERPRQGNGLPMYPWDRPAGALPGLSLRPSPAGLWDVSVMLLVQPRTGQGFDVKGRTLGQVMEILDSYMDDPEATMKDVFKWPGLGAEPPPKALQPRPSPLVSDLLSKLGLKGGPST